MIKKIYPPMRLALIDTEDNATVATVPAEEYNVETLTALLVEATTAPNELAGNIPPDFVTAAETWGDVAATLWIDDEEASALGIHPETLPSWRENILDGYRVELAPDGGEKDRAERMAPKRP